MTTFEKRRWKQNRTFYVFLFLHNVDGNINDANSLMIEER